MKQYDQWGYPRDTAEEPQPGEHTIFIHKLAAIKSRTDKQCQCWYCLSQLYGPDKADRILNK